MTTPTDLIRRVQEKHNAVQTAYQTHQDNLLNLVQQMQNLMRGIQTQLQDLGQKQQGFTTQVDQTLQTLEQEMGKKNGLIASISAKNNNALLKQEMVAQKRTMLLQGLKQMDNQLKQLNQEATNVQDQAHQGLQQVQKDQDLVRTSLQDLLTELTSLSQEIKNLEVQTAQTQSSAQGQVTNSQPAQGSTIVNGDILTKLSQAEMALLNLKQGIDKSRIMHQVTYNINEFGFRYNLQ
ncbi:MAG: hypothetical protein ACOYEO_00260 [bacterium]|jgi:chromosome segregation ATPase